MASAQETVLRPIAEDVLDQTFPGLRNPKRNDYATSMVRQWLTCDGWAMFFTFSFEFKFHMVPRPDGTTEVGCHVDDNKRIEPILSAGILDEDLSSIFEQLNVCQSASCYAYGGQPMKIRIEPARRNLYVEFDFDSPRQSDEPSN
jgi:hypothetical protein